MDELEQIAETALQHLVTPIPGHQHARVALDLIERLTNEVIRLRKEIGLS